LFKSCVHPCTAQPFVHPLRTHHLIRICPHARLRRYAHDAAGRGQGRGVGSLAGGATAVSSSPPSSFSAAVAHSGSSLQQHPLSAGSDISAAVTTTATSASMPPSLTNLMSARGVFLGSAGGGDRGGVGGDERSLPWVDARAAAPTTTSSEGGDSHLLDVRQELLQISASHTSRGLPDAVLLPTEFRVLRCPGPPMAYSAARHTHSPTTYSYAFPRTCTHVCRMNARRSRAVASGYNAFLP